MEIGLEVEAWQHSKCRCIEPMPSKNAIAKLIRYKRFWIRTWGLNFFEHPVVLAIEYVALRGPIYLLCKLISVR